MAPTLALAPPAPATAASPRGLGHAAFLTGASEPAAPFTSRMSALLVPAPPPGLYSRAPLSVRTPRSKTASPLLRRVTCKGSFLQATPPPPPLTHLCAPAAPHIGKWSAFRPLESGLALDSLPPAEWGALMTAHFFAPESQLPREKREAPELTTL